MDKVKISETDLRLASSLKALGNPVRLAMIRQLIERGKCPSGNNPCCCGEQCEGKNCKCGCKCGELVELFPMSQSTISQHIKELKNSGLIETKGRKDAYKVNYQNLREIISSLIELTGYVFDDFPGKNICCQANHRSAEITLS